MKCPEYEQFLKLTRLQPFQVGRIENFQVSQLEMAVTWSILELATSFRLQ